MVPIAVVHNRARAAGNSGDLPAPIEQPPRAVQPDAVGVPNNECVARQGRVSSFVDEAG
jgi:hypothetical protein